MEMNAGKPLLDIETWTLLVNAREISMTQDLGFRIVGTEALSSQPSGLACGCRQDDVREYVITDEKKA